MMLHILLVGIGGFFGAIARYSFSKILNKPTAFLPWGTLTVNLVGAFLLGIISGAKADPVIALIFGTGFMGAFTTFSTLKLELTKLVLKKESLKFSLYTIITYGVGLILAYIGFLLGTYLI